MSIELDASRLSDGELLAMAGTCSSLAHNDRLGVRAARFYIELGHELLDVVYVRCVYGPVD